MVASPGTPRGVIFQCAACRALVSTTSLVQRDDRGGLACDACGAVTWLPLGAGAAGSARVVVDVNPEPATPALALTGSAPAASTALATTGASGMAARFSDEQRASIDDRLRKIGAVGEAQADLATSFERLLGQWGSEAEHKNVLKKASLVGELAFMGQRYRAVLDVVPGDAQAKKAQNDILGLAMASMSADKGAAMESGAGGNNKTLAAAVIVVVGVLMAIGVFVYLPRLMDSALNPDGDLGPTEGQNVADPPPGR